MYTLLLLYISIAKYIFCKTLRDFTLAKAQMFSPFLTQIFITYFQSTGRFRNEIVPELLRYKIELNLHTCSTHSLGAA